MPGFQGNLWRRQNLFTAGHIPPGGNTTWTVEIEYYILQSQRIITIKNFEIAFINRFEEDRSTYYDVVPILPDNRAGDNLLDITGMKIYEDKELTLTAAYGFRGRMSFQYTRRITARNMLLLSAERL